MDEKCSPDTELIIVFRKGVEPQRAEQMMKDARLLNYREGMDSSRGKIYFYSTGPKFMVTFSDAGEKERFIIAHKDSPDIHELYTPDWTKQKD